MTASLEFRPRNFPAGAARLAPADYCVDRQPVAVVADPHRRRVVDIGLAIVVAVAIVVGLVGFGGGAAANGPLDVASADSVVVDATEVYIVQPGDTLWSIAAAITPEGHDVRPVVDYLSSVAGGSRLDVGQRIVIDHSQLGATG